MSFLSRSKTISSDDSKMHFVLMSSVKYKSFCWFVLTYLIVHTFNNAPRST